MIPPFFCVFIVVVLQLKLLLCCYCSGVVAFAAVVVVNNKVAIRRVSARCGTRFLCLFPLWDCPRGNVVYLVRCICFPALSAYQVPGT